MYCGFEIKDACMVSEYSQRGRDLPDAYLSCMSSSGQSLDFMECLLGDPGLGRVSE